MAVPLSPSDRLDTITAKDLTPLVRQVLGGETVTVIDWTREAEAYRVGLFDHLSGGLRAARCYGVVEYPDEARWVWMEDVCEVLPRR